MDEKKIGTIEVIRKNRRGSDVIRKLIKIDRNNTKYWLISGVECNRCGGMGGSHAWDNSGYICYDCGGSGLESKERIEKEYTPEHQAKLDAQRAKRHEKKQQEFVENLKKEIAEEYPDHKIYIVLGTNKEIFEMKDKIKADGGRFNSIHKWYFKKPVDGYKLYAVDLDDAFGVNAWKLPNFNFPIPVELPKTKPASTSEWVGSIGERMVIKVKMIACHEYERPCFNCGGSRGEYYARHTETAYIYTFEDVKGNKFVWKTGSVLGKYEIDDRDYNIWKSCKPEEVIMIKATVKKHGEYKDEKQTELQRVNLIDWCVGF